MNRNTFTLDYILDLIVITLFINLEEAKTSNHMSF